MKNIKPFELIKSNQTAIWWRFSDLINHHLKSEIHAHLTYNLGVKIYKMIDMFRNKKEVKNKFSTSQY